MAKVKVCGITSVEDALVAAGAGADAVGFVFFERSPRRVGVERAREISGALPGGVLRVGVFVNTPPEEVLRVASLVGLDYAQLHGDEGPEEVRRVREGGLGVIKALRVRDAGSLSEIERYPEADLFLLDAWREGLYGGTGTPFDWELAKRLRGCANIVVSGGLTPENVRAAIERLDPYGVDASSSLEEAPGKKSGELVRRFVSAAKS
ncbi:phosphoribosylanthranilate isomerase [Rubrobacter xylanophilus DSM 9941]|uniref:N-(5'-phosphoribosyl)anthranilate isomerase n=1 Tax=Rubrobacter xylanophilus (strain DSM 9941 / JCM 11954 / NBRC 16129 / PRD-1) TaxID=266117 RepID=TRPF_RUBXD|nr:phosphoribosylanthranilate isomerase [Rubrobacter xylanophilus]Q1AU93.1 RecName: Full=N-(5'-phosphoribosyl)anthranilate isomerase; Short=PRAI [Rubrobacter xylanophilus DSM 9941]ABG05035.1 phosphoribosylanthranilate isomerase [Rubrobacter xylanophilus DSM 9941]